MTTTAASFRTIRAWMLFVIFGLLVSGITAFPLQTELDQIAELLNIPNDASPAEFVGLRHWIALVRQGLHVTNRDYPFMAYGTDWLAFAHLVLAVLFIGPLRDPVRNIWVIEFGMIACAGVIPLAMICGPIRGIPFYWRCIDCSFAIIAIGPLWICRHQARTIERSRQDTT